MNDYHCVDNFSPQKSVEEHTFSTEWFESCVPMLRGTVFMVTHHAPSPQSIQGRYLASVPMYSSDMEAFIRKHPNIKYWAHGHCHHTSDYMVEQCRVISNPRGYVGMEVNPTFNPDFSVDVIPDPITV